MITRPQPNEASELVALSEATGFFNADEVIVVQEMLESFYQNPTSEEYTWIVWRETAGAPPRGYACYGPASLAVGTYDLYWIAVDRAFQSKKIGSALLDAMEQDLVARNARQIYIETSDKEQYAPTRAFYERRGYTLAAHYRDYYDVGDGKVVYLKVLNK